MIKKLAAALAVSLALCGPVLAQDAPSVTAAPAATEQACELHVWPTQNYLGLNTGLLAGFGIVGALADVSVHKDRVMTVKELMRDYLGPEVQLEELNRIGLLQSLKLPPTTRVIIEEPTPWNEDLKRDPALKARVAAMNKTLKANERLTASHSPCYVELLTTMVFYHKAMMYGSNLFTGWIYRDFGDKPTVQKYAAGAVKNPLEVFPAKTPEQVDAAKAELREAFVKDYNEWLAKKFAAAAPPR
ncbi:MAG: hypothetical protein ABI399_06740 [Bauldia sp.]